MNTPQSADRAKARLAALNKRVTRIERTFLVLAGVAAVFGIGAGYGGIVLRAARENLTDLNSRITEIEGKTKSLDTWTEEAERVVSQAQASALGSINNERVAAITAIQVERSTTVSSEVQSQLAGVTIPASRVNGLTNHVNSLLAGYISFGASTVKDCTNAPSGQNQACSCADGQMLVGIRYRDVEDDEKDTEQITGIYCRAVTIRR